MTERVAKGERGHPRAKRCLGLTVGVRGWSRLLFLVLGVFVLACRPMPPIEGDADTRNAAPRRQREFHEAKYTDRTPEQWRSLLNHRNPQVRDQAIDALLQYGPQQIPYLIDIARDSSKPTARMAAIRALGAFGPKAAEAIPVLIAALQDQTWDGRDVAAESLGFIRQADPQVVAALKTALGDTDERVRMAAARALGRLRTDDAKAIEALISALRDPDSSVQMTAVEALGEIGPPAQKALGALESLATTASPVLRASIQQALARIKGETKHP